MARLLRAAIFMAFFFYAGNAFAAGGTCPLAANYWDANVKADENTLVSLSSLGITSCYYISKTIGSDTAYDGTQETINGSHGPWAHLPGMPSCTGNCALHTPAAGEGYILRGGDSWLNSDLGIYWNWGGTSTSPIYIGVDPAWYSGSTWARPVFNCQGSPCSNSAKAGQSQLFINGPAPIGSYVTFDNIEWTGWKQSGGPAPVTFEASDHIIVENNYFHGWSRASGETLDAGAEIFDAYTAGPTLGAAAVAGTTFRYNIVDGSDTSKDMMTGVNSAENVYNNVFNYLVVGIHNQLTNVHGNLVENVVYSYQTVNGGNHCDAIFMFSALGNTQPFTQYMYNNVVHDTVSGCGILWLSTFTTCATCVGYAFNNVDYNILGFGSITVGNHLSYGSTGTYYVFNNTLHESGGACIANSDNGSPGRSTTYYGNNYCIGNAGVVCSGGGTTCVNNGTNLTQTEAQANRYGYTATEQYAYSPNGTNSPTGGAGTNYSSLCSTIPGICSDTSYPTYDQTNHVVVMRTLIQRPGIGGGAWDIGAYQFSSSQSQALQAPTGLTAVVQ
jgi:hypothetical protein